MPRAVERRLKWDLFSFLVVDSEYYEDLSQYEPRPHLDYYSRIVDLLPADWRLEKRGVWYNVVPRDLEVPRQGFKIHISATCRTATDVLHRVLPICVGARVSFKVLVDEKILDFMNSKNSSRSSSGKFITIYPPDREACLQLLEELDQATRGLAGPFILSDRPYKDSKVVFYRYGSFRPNYELNLFGEQIPMMEGPGGELVPDTRPPFFQLPQGVEDLCPPSEEAHEGEVRLNERYVIAHAIRFSNSGGVYLAEDLHRGQQVVIKEARPWVNTVRNGQKDAVSMLKKEAAVLEVMADTGVVPERIDLFQEWEHHFLVEEYLDGSLLANYRGREDVALLLQRNPTPEDIEGFCQRFARIGLNLLTAVRLFHERGVIIGDLSPMNIFVDPETCDVRLIDFEGAYWIEGGDSHLDTTVTAGYVSPSRLDGEAPQIADDFFSLGSVLYSLLFPVQELFPLKPAARSLFLASLARDLNLPSGVRGAIEALLDGDDETAEAELRDLERPRLQGWHHRLDEPGRASRSELEEVVTGVRDYILAVSTPDRTDRLWPSDYRLFTTNPLGLAYGALGTATFLVRRDGELPEAIRDWLIDRSLSLEGIPPGLFVGSAGISWGLAELGELERAAEVMDAAYASSLAQEGWDLFFGAAGMGLAALHLWSRCGERRFLELSERSAEQVLLRARQHERGLYWLNTDGTHYYGYGHGGSGVAFFLLRLYEASGQTAYLEAATQALEYEIAQGEDRGSYVVWERSAGQRMYSPYWRHGTAGIGSVLLRFAQVLGGDRYLDLARRASNYAASKYAVFPSQLEGLSGMGELLVDLYRHTGNTEDLGRARRVADGVLLYGIDTPRGIAFPGEELIRLSTDFGTGSAGIAMFLQRVANPGPRFLFDFDLG